jgi:hypothetical protein
MRARWRCREFPKNELTLSLETYAREKAFDCASRARGKLQWLVPR